MLIGLPVTCVPLYGPSNAFAMCSRTASRPSQYTPDRIMVPSSTNTLANVSASWYAHAATTFCVSAAIAAWSAWVIMLVSPLRVGELLDVKRVGLEPAQHTAVEFGVRVGVHERVQVHGLHVAVDPLDRDPAVDRGPAAGRGEDLYRLLGEPDDRADVGARPRALLELPLGVL